MPSSAVFEALDDQDLVPNWCAERFGIDKVVFSQHRFWSKKNRGDVWITSAESVPVDLGKVSAFGLLVMRRYPPRGKPTSVFLQRFAGSANRNFVDLTRDQLRQYFARDPLPINDPNLSRGSCVVRARGRVIGCGRWDEGLLINQWPKHYTADLPGQCPILVPLGPDS